MNKTVVKEGTNSMTTVRISKDVWRAVNAQKLEPGETFDDVMRRILGVNENE